jgi:hypothetical protein
MQCKIYGIKLQSFFYSILKCLFVQTFSLKEYASSFVAIFGISFSFNNGAKESVIKLLGACSVKYMGAIN